MNYSRKSTSSLGLGLGLGGPGFVYRVSRNGLGLGLGHPAGHVSVLVSEGPASTTTLIDTHP